MQWHSQYSAREGSQRMTAEAVVLPKDHEGIGNALRSAYLPRTVDLPKEFRDLLNELN
jgi:hypothetical protein